jgi:hypothetical protein
MAFLPKDHGLAVAIISYNGFLNFGLLADYDALPDVEALGAAIESAAHELIELARDATGRRADADAPVPAPV